MHHWKKINSNKEKVWDTSSYGKLNVKYHEDDKMPLLKLTTARKQSFNIKSQATYTYTIETTQFHGWFKPSQLNWAKHCPETLSNTMDCKEVAVEYRKLFLIENFKPLQESWAKR